MQRFWMTELHTVMFPLPSHRPYMHNVHPLSYIQHLHLDVEILREFQTNDLNI